MQFVKILFLNKNEKLQMGQDDKIVGYLWNIIWLLMGHMRYLRDISVTKWTNKLLMGHNVPLMGYLMLHDILYYIGLGILNDEL